MSVRLFAMRRTEAISFEICIYNTAFFRIVTAIAFMIALRGG